MKSLEQMFKDDAARDVIDYRLRARVDSEGAVSFYLHPDGVDGETPTFMVMGDAIIPAPVLAPNQVDSSSDDRVLNNVMRHGYRVLDDAEKTQMRRLKDMGSAFYRLIEQTGTSREMSIAKTKLEEVVMWAVKHVTR